jgi:hypothetical protein
MISCFKTILGEDLIGDVEIHDDTVDIDSPLMIMIVPTEKGQYSVGLAPYMVFAASRKFTFKKEHIMFFYEAADEIKADYTRITGKGIIVPNTKIQLVP